jgi:ATP-dependent helicase/nuclease subunit B
VTVQFILGRSGSGKSSYCLNEIKKKLIQSPDGPPIVYLVPDQMTFQAEYELISTPELQGMTRAQVFSFSRLALRILQEVGGASRLHIDKVGMAMILRRIIEQRKQELKVFQRSAEQQGFYEQLEQMITECKRYCVTSEVFIEKQQEITGSQVLKDKLHDLHLIYGDLENYMLGRYIDSEDLLQLLVQKISRSTYLQEAEFIVDGFHQFTPQEELVIQALMKRSKSVKIALTLDQAYDNDIPHEIDLFYPTSRTYQQLNKLAEIEKVPVQIPLLLEQQKRHQNKASLAHLETYYDHRPNTPFSKEAAITLSSAVNRRAEVEGVARQLLSMARDSGYRWRDMAVLVRDMNIYQDLIETIFEDYEIPLFIDQKRSMLHHPLIEFIRSVLDCFMQNWRYEAIFRCVKTDLLFAWENQTSLRELREELDQLENYVLANGINGWRWTDEQRWSYGRIRNLEDEEFTQSDEDLVREQRIHELRSMIVQPLKGLQNRFSQCSDVRQMCEELYLFLEELDIPEKIELWREQAEFNGDLRESREHQQAWKAVLHLLDQLVEMMGSESVSLELFSKMIETGCDSMRFALVPPAIDQVLVGSLERSRFTHVKNTFILGANEGILPAKPKEDSLISEEEREKLFQLGVRLAPSSKEQLVEEQFVIYTALCSSSDYLWVSYALADEEGKTLVPSGLLNRIKKLFPAIKEQLIVNDPYELPDDKQLSYITHPQKTISYLASELRQWKKGYTIVPFWWDVYNWFIEKKDVLEHSANLSKVVSSLFYKNQAKQLELTTSRELYGSHFQTSVSRMERYTACPFSQFLSHGLRLRDREVFRLEAPDIGQLFHAALKLIDDELRESGRTWHGLTKLECQQLASAVVERIAPRLQGKILLSSNRHHYIKRKLEQVVGRAATVLTEHAKSSEFSPVGLEVDFGPRGPLPGMKFLLNNGVTMEVVGRIDRVDKAKGTRGLMLRVIDYKSSQKALDLSEVYYGLSLQMLTYLDVIITHAKSWLGEQATPTGVLYFHVHNPLLNRKKALPQDEIDKELYKQFKMKGLVLADKEAVQLMDTTLETQYSEVIPVALKKDGQFYSSSSVASIEDFGHLRTYVRKQIQIIGTQISEGNIDIKPFKMKKKTACTFCSYRSVCQFDLEFEEQEYTTLATKGKDVVLTKIRLEGGQQDE